MSNPAGQHDNALFRRFVALGFLLLVPHIALVIIQPGGSTVAGFGSTVFLVVEGAFATALCGSAFKVSHGRIRRSWACFAYGAGLWTLANIVGLLLGVPAGNSIGISNYIDVPPIAFIPFVIAGLLSLAVYPSTSAARSRALLDAFIVAVALGYVTWAAAIYPNMESIGAGFWTSAGVVASAALDIALVTVALSVGLSTRERGVVAVPTAAALGAMVAFFVGSDTAIFTTIDSGLRAGSIIDAGWAIGLVSLGIAAAWPGLPVRRMAHQRASFVTAQALPSLVATIVLTMVLIRVNRTNDLDLVSIWLASCLFVCVLIRQVVTSIEEQRLAQLLEARVNDRTEQLSRREQQFRALVQHSSDVIVILSEEGTFDYVSPSVQYVLGHSAESLAGGSIGDIVHPEDRSRVTALLAMASRRNGATMTAEWRINRADGSLRQVEVLVRNLVSEPAVGGIVLNLRDVTERKELEDQLTHQALHDDLTGLPNRSLLRLRIEQALARWLFQNEPFSLIVADVDDFKAINDSLGHVAGDVVLKTLAERIGHCIRRGDTLVRLGGDEFAVLLEGVAADDEEAHNVAERIIDSARKPIRVEGRQMALRASIGLACVTEQVSQADDIMRNADLALHHAKSSNRGGYAQFELSMHNDALRRVELEADLRRALERDELQLYYQPTVDIATGKFEGVEALLRWPHPDRGFISPADFIPLAEESGLIVPIGTWVLRQACNEMAKWQGRYPSNPPLKMNVNLSGLQLDQPDIVETVKKALEDSGIAPGSLVLEMTESVLMDNKGSTRARMEGLVDLGCDLAIDDFGTGYSSLSYLRQFPISVLKIDRSFVNEIGSNGSEEESALVQAIVDLARTLQLRTVAEGIETQDQLNTLREMGCDIGQGFLLAKPAPAEEVRRLLEKTHAVGLPIPVAATSL